MSVRRAETAKLIKTPFEMLTRKSLRNHVLGETRISHGNGQFWLSHLGMARLAGGQYAQRYLQETAATRPLATVNLVTCYTCTLVNFS